MFATENRLAKDRDVKTVLRAGRAFFDPFFTIRLFRTKEPGIVRCTVVVSTKVAKQAVKRNRIKRIIRDFLRRRLTELLVGDYMVIVRPAIAKQEPADIRARLALVLARNRLLK